MFFCVLQLSQAGSIHDAHEVCVFRCLVLICKALNELPLFSTISICALHIRVEQTFVWRHHLSVDKLLESLEALDIQYKRLHKARFRLVASIQLEHEQAA